MNLNARRCDVAGCSVVATFRTPGDARRFCLTHKRDSDSNGKYASPCAAANCTRRGYCTLPGPDAAAPRWCNRHKPAGAADTFNRLCAHAGCTTLASFPGPAGAKLCAAHSPSKGPGRGRRAAADPPSLGAKKGGAQRSSRAAGVRAGRRGERLRRGHAEAPPTGREPSEVLGAAGAGVCFWGGPPPSGAGSVGWIVGGRAANEGRSGLSLRGGEGGGGAGGESREELGDENDYGDKEEEEEEEEEWRGRDGPLDAAAGPAAGSARTGVTWASLAPEEEPGASQSASALGGDDRSGAAAAGPGHVEDLVATLDAVRPAPWPFEITGRNAHEYVFVTFDSQSRRYILGCRSNPPPGERGGALTPRWRAQAMAKFSTREEREWAEEVNGSNGVPACRIAPRPLLRARPLQGASGSSLSEPPPPLPYCCPYPCPYCTLPLLTTAAVAPRAERRGGAQAEDEAELRTRRQQEALASKDAEGGGAGGASEGSELGEPQHWSFPDDWVQAEDEPGPSGAAAPLGGGSRAAERLVEVTVREGGRLSLTDALEQAAAAAQGGWVRLGEGAFVLGGHTHDFERAAPPEADECAPCLSRTCRFPSGGRFWARR